VVALAAAVSAHPVSARATGEVVGEMLERVGPGPDLLVVAVSTGHAGALEDITVVIRELLRPGVLIGAVVDAVGVGGADAVVTPAVGLWGGATGPALGAKVRAGCATSLPGPGQLRIVVGADPAAVPPGALVVAGGPLLVLDGEVVVGGSVAATVASTAARVVAVDGLRPLGPPQRVGGAARVVRELGGRPARDRLVELARDGMAVADLGALRLGLHLRDRHGRCVSVLGAEPGRSSLVVDGDLPDGTLVEVLVVDPSAALGTLAELASGASGALVVRPAGWRAARPAVERAELPAATLWLTGGPAPAHPAAWDRGRPPSTTAALFP
jgi:small ligand-binding sensory domain FIST